MRCDRKKYRLFVSTLTDPSYTNRDCVYPILDIKLPKTFHIAHSNYEKQLINSGIFATLRGPACKCSCVRVTSGNIEWSHLVGFRWKRILSMFFFVVYSNKKPIYFVDSVGQQDIFRIWHRLVAPPDVSNKVRCIDDSAKTDVRLWRI